MTTAHARQAPEPPSLATFGARLAIIRWAMRWNLKEAALACNVPQGSWREWELFDRVPRNLVEVAGKISTRTGYDDYWIMTGKQKAPVSDEGHEARPEGFEPPTFCLGDEPGGVVLDITDRLPTGSTPTSNHLAPVVVLR